MTDTTAGTVLRPGQGERIRGGGLDATLKSAMGATASTSSFEVVVPPRFDVGAHVHHRGEEVFFVLEGQLDLLAVEPVDRELADWHEWVAPDGTAYLRGGPGAFIHVPAGVPHAFANTTTEPARMFFQSSSPGGHENYFRELSDMLRRGDVDAAIVAALRERYDIHQLTTLDDGHAASRYRP
jgi:mannose-6-phosphate isomerase-like protein (cupin superfamily)